MLTDSTSPAKLAQHPRWRRGQYWSHAVANPMSYQANGDRQGPMVVESDGGVVKSALIDKGRRSARADRRRWAANMWDEPLRPGRCPETMRRRSLARPT